MTTQLLNLNKSSGILNLAKAAPALTKVRCVLNWEPALPGRPKLDLDPFAFCLDANRKLVNSDAAYVVFYGNKMAHGVTIPRDNRSGEGTDDEEVIIDFTKVPSNVVEIDVFIFIFEAAKRMQTLVDCKGAHLLVSDGNTGAPVQLYKLDQYPSGSSVSIGTFARRSDGWHFEPVGTSGAMDPNEVASFYI